MKKVILALALLASVPAFAQHHGHYGHRHGGHGHGWGWGPVVGGAILGAVVYDIYNRPVVVQQQPVIVQQPPVVYQSQPNCGPWKEVQSQDGTVYRERTCTQ
jgi:hypothetical protein